MSLNSNPELLKSGWAVIPWECQRSLIDLSLQLGTPQKYRGSATPHFISPRKATPSLAPSLSAEYGYGTFPLHTDMTVNPIPPKYTVLRLAPNSTSDTPTTLLKFPYSALSNELISSLTRGSWSVMAHRPFLTSVLTTSTEATFVRFDRDCMTPRSPLAAHAHNALIALLASLSPEPVLLKMSQALIIDNHTTLHGRGVVTQADIHSRQLERLFIL